MSSPSPIIAKIRALRELARRNTNENEAAAAAAAAEKLCQEHRIAEATIEAGEPSGAPGSAEVDQFKRIEPWRSYLLTDIAKLHGCSVVYLRTKGRGYEAVAYGAETDLEVVREMYAWLVAEVERIAQATGGSPKWRHSFKVGASEGIRDAMADAHELAMGRAKSTAITVLDARLVAAQDEIKRRHGKIRKLSTSAPRVEERAFSAGREAGRSLTEQRERSRGVALNPRPKPSREPS